MGDRTVEIVPAVDYLPTKFEALDTGGDSSVEPTDIRPLLSYVFDDEGGIYEQLTIDELSIGRPDEPFLFGDGSVTRIEYTSRRVAVEDVLDFTFEIRLGTTRGEPVYDSVEVIVEWQ